MSIANYSDLQTAVQDWLVNTVLSTRAPDFIMLGQLRIYREIRIRAMESTLNVTITNALPSAALPADYIELKNAYVNSNPTKKLQRRTPDWMYEFYPIFASQTGTPSYIARQGSSFIFSPTPDSNYNVQGIYYAQPALLSVSNPTNYFTASTPDLLLFAALAEASPYLNDEKNTILWETKYKTIMAEVQRQDRIEFSSGSDIRTTFSIQ